MKQKVIFVGMHNKPGTLPLCASTKTGKLIMKIICTLANDTEFNLDHVKTNLWDVEYFPKSEDERLQLSEDWFFRVQPKEGDIVVLLGQIVHTYYQQLVGVKAIKVAHPASKRSHEEMAEYVSRVVELIKKAAKSEASKLPDTAEGSVGQNFNTNLDAA